ncbi:hypothetical protein RB595_001950 [Gaeumannomyces hyphopodioides]
MPEPLKVAEMESSAAAGPQPNSAPDVAAPPLQPDSQTSGVLSKTWPILSLPHVPTNEPQAEQPVGHAPGQVWRQSSLANQMKYTHHHRQQELGENKGPQQLEVSVEVFWSKHGFWSYYEPTSADREALDSATEKPASLDRDDVLASYSSGNLGGHEVYVDLFGIHYYYHQNLTVRRDPDLADAQAVAVEAASRGDGAPADHPASAQASVNGDIAESATQERGASGLDSHRVATETAAQEDAVQEKIAQENVTQEDATQEDAAEEGAAQDGAIQEDAAHEDAAYENTAQESTAQKDVVQRDATHEDAAQQDVAQQGVAQEHTTHEDAAQEGTANEDATQEDVAQEQPLPVAAVADHLAGADASQQQSDDQDQGVRATGSHTADIEAAIEEDVIAAHPPAIGSPPQKPAADAHTEEVEGAFGSSPVLNGTTDTAIAEAKEDVSQDISLGKPASPAGAADTAPQVASPIKDVMSIGNITLPTYEESQGAGAEQVPKTAAPLSPTAAPQAVQGQELDHQINEAPDGQDVDTEMGGLAQLGDGLGPISQDLFGDLQDTPMAEASEPRSSLVISELLNDYFESMATDEPARDMIDGDMFGVPAPVDDGLLFGATTASQPTGSDEMIALDPGSMGFLDSSTVAAATPGAAVTKDDVMLIHLSDDIVDSGKTAKASQSPARQPEARDKGKRKATAEDLPEVPPPKKTRRSESPLELVEISQESWNRSKKRAADSQPAQTPPPFKKARMMAEATASGSHATPPPSSPAARGNVDSDDDDNNDGLPSIDAMWKRVGSSPGRAPAAPSAKIQKKQEQQRPGLPRQHPSNAGPGVHRASARDRPLSEEEKKREFTIKYARRIFQLELETIKRDAPLFDGPVVRVRGILADPAAPQQPKPQGPAGSTAQRPARQQQRPSAGASAENPISLERSPSPRPAATAVDLTLPPRPSSAPSYPTTGMGGGSGKPAGTSTASGSQPRNQAGASSAQGSVPGGFDAAPPPRRTTRAQDRAARKPRPPPLDGPAFYGLNDAPNSERLMRYQDLSGFAGTIPGTVVKSPHGHQQPDRLLIDKFRVDAGIVAAAGEGDAGGSARNQAGGAALKSNPATKKQRDLVHPKNASLHRLYGQEDDDNDKDESPAAAEAAKQRRRWFEDRPAQAALLRGFPLVESVEFLRSQNRDDEGNCYWNAMAMHVYGRRDWGPRVKLEHLRFVESVLANDRHPRHADYVRVNGRFVITSAEGIAEPFVANMWQLLHLPGSWTPSWMTQVTADLYGLFVVTYTLDENPAAGGGPAVTETTTRGSYNSRHIFLLFVDNNHYQPMVPNRHDDAEFRCPRPSRALTCGYKFGDSRRWGDGTAHAWRRDASFCALDKRVAPPLHVDHNMGWTTTEVKRLLDAVIMGGTGNWTA